MNKKGQALVEFIIILPVFVFMLLGMIDIGKIMFFNNQIESKMDDVVSMYENKYDYEKIKKSITKAIITNISGISNINIISVCPLLLSLNIINHSFNLNIIWIIKNKI